METPLALPRKRRVAARRRHEGRLFHYFEMRAKNSVAQKLHCTVSLHENGNLTRTQIRVPPGNFHFGCSSHKNVSNRAFVCVFGVTQNSEGGRKFSFRRKQSLTQKRDGITRAFFTNSRVT